MVLIYFVPQIFEYLKKFDTNLLSPGRAEVETLFSPITIRIVMGKTGFRPPHYLVYDVTAHLSQKV